MQIVGNNCKICGRTIVLFNEGKFCAQCGTFVHLTCLPQIECDVCSQQFQHDESPKPDPLRDAFLPPALRSANSGGPTFDILLAVTLVLLGILVFLMMQA